MNFPESVPPRVECLERHDQAYHLWREAGVRHRVLVHIDAHHDMWWCARPNDLSIANFLCLAMREDLVDQIVWVVPDATWEHAGSRQAVLRHLERLQATYPSPFLLGKRLTVCALSSLPRLDVPVLLDLDVDFFVIPFVSHGESDTHSPLPWRWPAELMDQLHASGLQFDMVTIAYSVEGGYTPLKWKYLGDEFARRLTGIDEEIEGFSRMRAGAIAAATGEWLAAAEAFQQAARLLPQSAAPHCHLADACLAMGRDDAARGAWREALTRDPSYRTAYSNDGLLLYADRRHLEAESSWRRALVLDPSDAYAYLGLAFLEWRRGDWRGVEQHAREALAINPDLVDAHRMLGRTLAAQRKTSDAIARYERSIRLTLSGHRPIAADIATVTDDRPADPELFSVFARLARLYLAKGDVPRALENHRMAAAGRVDEARFHTGLAWLYLRSGRLALSAREWWKGLMIMGRQMGNRFKRRSV